MEIAVRSITGKVRENNEDSVLGISISQITKGIARDRALLVLADGMGGGSAGEVASEILTTVAREHLWSLLTQDSAPADRVEAAIQTTIADANKRIADYAADNKIDTIGTTATIAFVDGNEVTVCNVGDSRAYLINKSGIRQITRDHSAVWELFEQGVITKDRIRTHPNKNLITKAVGLEENITADIFRAKIFRGDYLFLCCNGLWESMPELDIMTILVSRELGWAIDQLIAAANNLDGPDNVSALLGVPMLSSMSAEEFVQLTTKELKKILRDKKHSMAISRGAPVGFSPAPPSNSPNSFPKKYLGNEMMLIETQPSIASTLVLIIVEIVIFGIVAIYVAMFPDAIFSELIVLLIALLFMICPLGRIWLLRTTHYAVTDRRVISVSARFSKFVESAGLNSLETP